MSNEVQPLLAEALASEAKWRSLVENAPDVIMTVDRQGTILFINHTISEIQPEKVVGTNICDYMPEEYHGVVRGAVERVFKTGEGGGYDTKSLESYGSRWYTSRVGPVIQEGQVIAATIIATDITERKEMEEALRRAQEELEQRVVERTAELAQEIEDRKRAEEQVAIFQRFVENAGQGFGMTDLEGRIIYGNATIQRLCAIDNVEDVIGKSFTSYHTEEDRRKLEEEVIPAVLKDGQWMGELTLMTEKGGPKPVIVNYYLVQDEKGNPSRIAADEFQLRQSLTFADPTNGDQGSEFGFPQAGFALLPIADREF